MKPNKGSNVKASKTSAWKDRISQQDLEQLKNTFDLFDEEGNGQIDPVQINKILQQLGLNKRNDTVDGMLQDLLGKKRPVNFQQFIEIICGRIGDTKSKDGIEKIFNLYDKDGAGQIDFEKFQNVARQLGQTMTDEQLKQLMHNTHILNQTQSNQFFTFEEFYEVVTKKRY